MKNFFIYFTAFNNIDSFIREFFREFFPGIYPGIFPGSGNFSGNPGIFPGIRESGNKFYFLLYEAYIFFPKKFNYIFKKNLLNENYKSKKEKNSFQEDYGLVEESESDEESTSNNNNNNNNIEKTIFNQMV